MPVRIIKSDGVVEVDGSKFFHLPRSMKTINMFTGEESRTALEVAHMMLTNWEGVIDEDGAVVPFSSEAIDDLDPDTFEEISTGIMKNFKLDVKPEGNSESTSTT